MKPEVRALLTTHTFRAIYRKGREAGLAGKPRECPYSKTQETEKLRIIWLHGWDAGALAQRKRSRVAA
jgi:ribosome modulation factor